MNEEKEVKAGRPSQPGEQKMIAIRVMSKEDYDMVLNVPTVLRAKILIEWYKNNMAILLGSE